MATQARVLASPVFLPGESHGEGSLEGYSPWGRKKSDATAHASSWSPVPRPQKQSRKQHRLWKGLSPFVTVAKSPPAGVLTPY